MTPTNRQDKSRVDVKNAVLHWETRSMQALARPATPFASWAASRQVGWAGAQRDASRHRVAGGRRPRTCQSSGGDLGHGPRAVQACRPGQQRRLSCHGNQT